MEQETLLQIYCRKLGVMSDRSPVAHCEIAGEDIEFDWGFTKLTYRAKTLSEKRNKQTFHKLVHKVLSSEVLTLDTCRANARRARQYMLAYMTLEVQKNQNRTTTPTTTSNEQHNTKEIKVEDEIKVTHMLIEECASLFRRRQTHCSAINFNRQFLKDSIILKNVVDGMATFPKQKKIDVKD